MDIEEFYRNKFDGLLSRMRATIDALETNNNNEYISVSDVDLFLFEGKVVAIRGPKQYYCGVITDVQPDGRMYGKPAYRFKINGQMVRQQLDDGIRIVEE